MHPLGLSFETPEPVFAGTGVSFIRDFFYSPLYIELQEITSVYGTGLSDPPHWHLLDFQVRRHRHVRILQGTVSLLP